MIELIPLLTQFEIKKYLARDDIYKTCYLTNDLASENVFKGNISWYLVKEGNNEIGLLFLKEFSNMIVVPHGGIYKQFRGSETPRRIKEILRLINLLGLVTIITIPSKSFKVLKLMPQINYTYKMTIPNGCINDDLLVFGAE